MGEADRGIYFDEEYQIRILDVDKFNASKSLQDNTTVFLDNIQSLTSLVEKHLSQLDQQEFRGRSVTFVADELLMMTNSRASQPVAEKSLRNLVSRMVDRIEAEKLRAVGLRNKVATLEEERRRKQRDQERLLAEKQEELERLLAEEQSLLKVKQEQELLVAKLSDSSVGAAF